MQNIAINDVGQEYDPLTLLRSRTLFGRPDFRNIFSTLKTSIQGGSFLPGREATLKTRLGVYFCGVSDASGEVFAELNAQPNPLARVIKAEALKCKTDSIEVRFAKEHF